MDVFVGVDCSKYKAHIVVLDENSKITQSDFLVSGEKKDIERMWEIKNQFEDWLLKFSEDYNINTDDIIVIIEGPIFLQNVKTSFEIAKTINGIEIACMDNGSKCFEIQNTVWKKAIIGNGACSKEDILKFAQTKWKKHKFNEQDYADAACIALHMYLLMSNKKR